MRSRSDDRRAELGQYRTRVDLLFFTAIGLSVAAVRPLALPLIKVADALPVSPTGVSRSGAETLVE